MVKLGFEIITAERVVYSDEVDVVVAPGIDLLYCRTTPL